MDEIVTDEQYYDDITPIQMKAIRVLLTKGSISAALRIVGVSRTTLYRWCNEDAAFRAVLRSHTRAILDNTTRNLVMAAEDCVTLLTSVVNDPDATLTHRLRAADSVLNHLVRLVALSDMESRLAALEQLDGKEGTEDVFAENTYQETRAA
jgi:hypothetical protein